MIIFQICVILDPLLYDSPIASVYPYTFVYVPTLEKTTTATKKLHLPFRII